MLGYTYIYIYIPGCGVGAWSDWTDCTADCDTGTHNRTRTFTIVNDSNRPECDEVVLEETEPCNTDPCDGEWFILSHDFIL